MTYGYIRKAITVSVVFTAVFTIIYVSQAIGQVWLNQTVMKEIRGDIVRKIVFKKRADFEKYKDSDYLSLMTNDVKRIEDEYIDSVYLILTEAQVRRYGEQLGQHFLKSCGFQYRTMWSRILKKCMMKYLK